MPIAVTVLPFFAGKYYFSNTYGNLSSHTSQVLNIRVGTGGKKVSLIATQLSFKITQGTWTNVEPWDWQDASHGPERTSYCSCQAMLCDILNIMTLSQVPSDWEKVKRALGTATQP